jgi:O-antigen/teichoic acid export membrane protein
MLFYTLLFVSIVTASFTSLFAGPIISIVFGTGFIGAIGILQIYIWSNVGAAVNLLVHQLLLAEELTYISSYVTFFGMITNIALNLVFIPIYGITGAAIASLISYVIPFMGLYMFKKSRRLALQLFY